MKILKQNVINIYGDRGQKWLDSLPTVINSLETYWSIAQITPVTNMSYNYVAKAVRDNAQPVVIKVHSDRKSYYEELNALKYFQGAGSITLLGFNEQHNALLLEQAIPGNSLKELYPINVEKSIDIYISTMKKLHNRTSKQLIGFRHIRDWLVAIDNIPKNIISEHLITKACYLKNRLLNSVQKPMLLHGDLHHDNVVYHASSSSWLCIDPKGIIGDAEFEIAAFDVIHPDELKSNTNIKELFQKHIALLAEKSGLCCERIKQWIFVRLILSATWYIEDNGDPSQAIKVAEIVYGTLE